MSTETLTCSVCGGPMRRVKILPSGMSGLLRYKCTCGHCEDVKDDRKSTAKRDEALVLEGFHEIP